ncbi:MAG: flagellar motor protein MotB [Lachnospiraceae bacterium]|nr:flagellar motor protein MotB [Lachnospiraceae bacterium]
MAKRKEDTPKPGAPAWQTTFGDLMNLLLCFFVLLFSMSTVDAQKFQMIAASFSDTFSIFSAGASAIGDGVLISNGVSQLNELDQYINSTGKTAESESEVNELDEVDELAQEMEKAKLAASEELAEKVQESVTEKSLDKDIDITFTSQYVQLTLKGSILFDSGKAELREDALPIISKVAVILERYAQSTIEIEGHTDNVPIHNARFESNDVLSSYRALAMFNYLVDNTTLDPAMLKHSGRGEYIPVADNSTPEGRAKNRRIEIKIYNTLSGE